VKRLARPVGLGADTDTGAGAVLVLGVSGAFFVGAIILASVLGIAVIQTKGQVSADLSALAASQVLRGISTGIPCDRARQLAVLNMNPVSTCSIVGEEVTVATRTVHGGIVLNATATATSG